MITYFVVFHDRHNAARRISSDEKEGLAERICRLPALRKASLYTPQTAHDPYLDDGPPPQLALQLYFDDIARLEECLTASGPLADLEHSLPSLPGAQVSQQAMLARGFPVAAPNNPLHGDTGCTYLVSYPGPAQDLNAWLTHYIGGHPRLMARFPGIRAIEVCTRIDYCSGLPWPRAECILRNSIVFDSAPALTAALHSPIRHEMRADFARFPPFSGGNTHYPMETLTLLPGSGTAG